jgi:hypothetical protein
VLADEVAGDGFPIGKCRGGKVDMLALEAVDTVFQPVVDEIVAAAQVLMIHAAAFACGGLT